MNVRGVRRRVAAGCLVAGSLIALGAAPASASGIFTVDPNTDLVDNQQVTLYGSAFRANYFYQTRECETGPTGSCNSEVGGVTTDGAGNFANPAVVRRYITMGAGRVDCASAPRRCAVFVSDPSTGEFIGTSLTFKSTK